MFDVEIFENLLDLKNINDKIKMKTGGEK